MTNHVERTSHDRPSASAAVVYAAAVIALAGVMFAVYAVSQTDSLAFASVVPVILFFGALGAFIQAYFIWRVDGDWQVWHGTGWVLFILMLVSLGVPWSTTQI
jgi:hypothetical protein